MNLRVPGPTPCPDEVLTAMNRQMVNHRGPEFAQLLYNVTAGMKQCFETKGDLFIFSGAGTAGMEAAVVNFLSPGDRILCVIIGVFGNRFAQIAEAFGVDVVRLEFEWGTAADPDAIRKALSEDPSLKAVYVTHNETSTGITNDLETIAKVAKEFDKLVVVDAVSSISSIPLPVDEWHCDVVVTGSQKGWMIPPGLTMMSVSEEAWKAHAQAKIPRFFWDITLAKKYLERGETPFTPAVSLFYALDVGLKLLQAEGMPNVFERHRRVGERTRNGVKALGLELLAVDERFASNTVTAVKMPESGEASKLLKLLREKYEVVLAGGQGKLSGKIFRIGHLGFVSEADIDDVLRALQAALPEVGVSVPIPAGF